MRCRKHQVSSCHGTMDGAFSRTQKMEKKHITPHTRSICQSFSTFLSPSSITTMQTGINRQQLYLIEIDLTHLKNEYFFYCILFVIHSHTNCITLFRTPICSTRLLGVFMRISLKISTFICQIDETCMKSSFKNLSAIHFELYNLLIIVSVSSDEVTCLGNINTCQEHGVLNSSHPPHPHPPKSKLFPHPCQLFAEVIALSHSLCSDKPQTISN